MFVLTKAEDDFTAVTGYCLCVIRRREDTATEVALVSGCKLYRNCKTVRNDSLYVRH